MKLPRFLYHFTSRNNLSKIMKEGLRASDVSWNAHIANPSVFCVDIQNLAKSWSKQEICGYNLQSSLIFGQALKDGSRELCCVRIPTKALSSPVYVRNQKYILDYDLAKSGTEIVSKGNKYKLYQRNGQAIEYIHSGNIPPSSIEYVGSAKIADNIEGLFETSASQLNSESTKMLKSIFQDSPEIKAFG